MAVYKLKEEDIPVLYNGEKISEKFLKLSDRLSIVQKCVEGYVVQINQNGETFYMETTDYWEKRSDWYTLKDVDKYFQHMKVQMSDCVCITCDNQPPLDIIEIQLKDRVQELYISPKRFTKKEMREEALKLKKGNI